MRHLLHGWVVLVEMQVKLLLRNRSNLVGSLGLAIISMLIFGSLLGGDGAPLTIAVVDEDHSPAAAQVVAAFTATGGVRVTTPCPTCSGLDLLKSGDAAAVVVLPAGFGNDLTAGKAAAQVYYDGSNPQRGGQAQAVIAGVIGAVNRAMVGATEPISLTVQGVDRRVIRQIDWLTPGMVGMMVMWANLAVGATVIAWRERHILQRLAVTPLRSLTLILTQIVSRLAFSCLQVVVLLMIARLVFGVTIAGSYGALALVIVVATLAILAFGFVIGAFVPKSESAQAISTLIAFPMMFLGGSYFATDAAPAFLQPVIQAMPLTHINEALRQVMIYGGGLSDVRKHLLVLTVWMAGSLLVATRAFRWSS